MQNIVVNVCEKFHNNRFKNDRALVLWKSDNNHNNNDDGSTWGPIYRSKNNMRMYAGQSDGNLGLLKKLLINCQLQLILLICTGDNDNNSFIMN